MLNSLSLRLMLQRQTLGINRKLISLTQSTDAINTCQVHVDKLVSHSKTGDIKNKSLLEDMTVFDIEFKNFANRVKNFTENINAPDQTQIFYLIKLPTLLLNNSTIAAKLGFRTKDEFKKDPLYANKEIQFNPVTPILKPPLKWGSSEPLAPPLSLYTRPKYIPNWANGLMLLLTTVSANLYTICYKIWQIPMSTYLKGRGPTSLSTELSRRLKFGAAKTSPLFEETPSPLRTPRGRNHLFLCEIRTPFSVLLYIYFYLFLRPNYPPL